MDKLPKEAVKMGTLPTNCPIGALRWHLSASLYVKCDSASTASPPCLQEGSVSQRSEVPYGTAARFLGRNLLQNFHPCGNEKVALAPMASCSHAMEHNRYPLTIFTPVRSLPENCKIAWTDDLWLRCYVIPFPFQRRWKAGKGCA